MFSEYDMPVYDEWRDDDYPHRDDVDILEDTIGFFCDGDLRPDRTPVTIETLENLRRLCDAIPKPPAGYAICCDCYAFTPNSSGVCQHCGGEWCPF